MYPVFAKFVTVKVTLVPVILLAVTEQVPEVPVVQVAVPVLAPLQLPVTVTPETAALFWSRTGMVMVALHLFRIVVFVAVRSPT